MAKWQAAAGFTAAAVTAIVGYYVYNKPTPKPANTDTLKVNKPTPLTVNGVDTTKKGDSLKTLNDALEKNKH